MIEYALIADFNFAQIKEDSARIDSYLESQKIEFVIDEPVHDQVKQYVLWSLADLYTTHRAMEITSATEKNILLPDRPELHELLIHKTWTHIVLTELGWFDRKEELNLIILNTIGWSVVFSNHDILYDK
tara:strand:+ start:252 stop:638 length:387 start_codon:yes stop_codon:yes gene_type:complete